MDPVEQHTPMSSHNTIWCFGLTDHRLCKLPTDGKTRQPVLDSPSLQQSLPPPWSCFLYGLMLFVNHYLCCMFTCCTRRDGRKPPSKLPGRWWRGWSSVLPPGSVGLTAWPRHPAWAQTLTQYPLTQCQSMAFTAPHWIIITLHATEQTLSSKSTYSTVQCIHFFVSVGLCKPCGNWSHNLGF
jgi:hypothetical protein